MASFPSSAVSTLSLSASIQVSGITYSAGGSTLYTITASPMFALTLSGAGIMNNSGITQSFLAAGNNGVILFANSASAGFKTAFSINGGAVSGEPSGVTEFRDSSNAGSAAFATNSAAVSGAFGGVTQFFDSSTAGNGAFTTNGRTVVDGGSGVTLFYDTSSADDARFTTKGGTVQGALGGFVIFFNSSTASNGTFTNNGGAAFLAAGGATQFFDNSSASNGAFTIHDGKVSGGYGALLQFFDASTAANGTFTAHGGTFSGKGGGHIEFHDNSSASNGVFTTNGITANFAGPGSILFFDSSTAGNGTFITNGGGTNGIAGGGIIEFIDNSDAGDANFTNNGTTRSDGCGGATHFRNSSSAGNSTVITHGSPFRHFVCPGVTCEEHPPPFGGLVFLETATAANSTLIVHGGTEGGDGGVIAFGVDSTGGTARVEVFGNGRLDISGHHGPGVTIGSLEGTGVVFLGMNSLSVGNNNLSTSFSGVLNDGDGRKGGGGGTGGALTKIGSGTLTLSAANTYSGPTTINGGTLLAAHDGALGRNVSLTASGVTLTLQNGATNNYIADAASLSIVSGSTVILNFTGTPDTIGFLIVDGVFQPPGLYGSSASGAPNQLPQLTGLGELLIVPPPQLLNISTRTRVLTGDKVLIGGFIITGTELKSVLIRGIGPSLSGIGVGALTDPTLELYQGSGTVATNDNWKTGPNGLSQQAEIEATTIPPTNDLESAILVTLGAGAYTTILAGKDGGTGVGLVEVYDLTRDANSKVANISTRGFVDTGDNAMIGGLIVGGTARVIVRALGPSVPVAGALGDPTLELHDGSGTLVASNDNWRTRPDGSSQQAEIEATNIPPSNDLEAALVRTLPPGNYTAIMRGQNDTTGIGLVEAYGLP